MRKTVIRVFALCLMLVFAATTAYAGEKAGVGNGKIICLKNKASKKEYYKPDKDRDDDEDRDDDRHEDRDHKKDKHENKGHHEKKKGNDKKQKGNKKPAYVAVTGITINKTSTTISVGSWERLAAGVLPANATDKKYFWFSDNPRVAWVNPSGKVTGARPGTAVIYAVSRNGFKIASCTVTVTGTSATDRVVTGVSLNKSALTLNVDAGERLIATVNPSNAYNKAVTWRSSDSSVATVDRYGYVHAEKTGTAVITVRTDDGGKEAACTVTVTNYAVPVTSVSIVRNESYITLKEGASKRLSVKVLPDNASEKDVTWSTSDSNIVTVDSNGYITGVNDGSATITVTTDDGRKTDSCRVDVIPASQWVSVTGVRVNLINTTIPVGFTDRIRYQITPGNASDKEVRWSSSNTDVATVDAYGNVEAKRTGTAVITATTLDGDKTASSFVVVVPALDKPSRGILLNKIAGTLADGDTDNLTVIFYPANETYSLTWSSSNTNVATVNQNGRVTAEGPGTATITVQTSNGGTASYTVTVIP